MDVDVKVAIGMGGSQAPGQEFFNLGPDFWLDETTLSRRKKIAQTPGDWLIPTEFQVEANSETRIGLRFFNSVKGRRAIDKQARVAQDTPMVGLEDSLVDFRACAEIIGVNYKLFQGMVIVRRQRPLERKALTWACPGLVQVQEHTPGVPVQE
jgi:hypothetical protein